MPENEIPPVLRGGYLFMKVNYTINEFDIALEESIDGSIASCDIDAYV